MQGKTVLGTGISVSTIIILSRFFYRRNASLEGVPPLTLLPLLNP
jgi:hypothetical protein